MLQIILLAVRAIQFIFAVIVLGLTGHVAEQTCAHGSCPEEEIGISAPSQNSFLIFTSGWTILALIYLAVAPRFLASVANVLALFAVELLTTLFWFAGFIAYAVFHRNLVNTVNYFYIHGCDAIGNVCGLVEAAVVFGALEWALFVVTSVLAAMAAFKSHRGTGTTGGIGASSTTNTGSAPPMTSSDM